MAMSKLAQVLVEIMDEIQTLITRWQGQLLQSLVESNDKTQA